MQYILTALKAESKSLIRHFNLQRDLSFNFPVFTSQNISLAGIGVGKSHVKDRVEALLEAADDSLLQFINIGIAGGNKNTTRIGMCYLVNKIKDEATSPSYHPDVLVKHSFQERMVTTVKSGIIDGGRKYDDLVDMESSEIFRVCSSHVPIYHLAFLKIVSDHMDEGVLDIKPSVVSGLVDSNLERIMQFLCRFNNIN